MYDISDQTKASRDLFSDNDYTLRFMSTYGAFQSYRTIYFGVIAGLIPAIHVLPIEAPQKGVDARNNPAVKYRTSIPRRADSILLERALRR